MSTAIQTSKTEPENCLPPPYNSWEILPPWLPPDREFYPYQRMVRTPDGQTVPLLSLKGYEAFNCYKRFLLCSGSKKSTKTICIANKFLRNMWEVNGAVGAIIGHTMGNTKHGTWRDLIKFVLPGWQRANFGMRILRGPITDNASKKEMIFVSNQHGGESEIQLHSLDYELDVEKKFRSLRFSCLWLAEADLFTDRSVFDLLRQQLRMIGVPPSLHQFLFDCNPPIEGDEHWLHDVFRKAGDPKSKHYVKNHEANFKEFQFGLDDNPFMLDEEKNEIKDSYAHDPVKYARFCEGQWIVDTAGSLFNDNFMFNIHVVGKVDSPDRNEWEVIVPPEDAPRLLTGTDIGELNHCTSFIVPRIGEDDRWHYDCFDEVASLQLKVSIKTFARLMWERVQFWNEWFKTAYPHVEAPTWRHWAGSDVFNYDASNNNCDADTFLEVSNGEIYLRAPRGQRGHKQIGARVAMMKRLFHENRFLISAKCKHNIDWARFLRPGKMKNEAILPGSPYRHMFDASSYCVGAELPHELNLKRAPSVAVGVVSVG